MLQRLRTPRAVVLLGLALVAAHVAFRAWIVYPSWFFGDDYLYLADARGERLTASYLLEAYNGHLMPSAKLVIWLVAQAGPLSWPAAATSSLLAQALAALSCLWALVRLFGPRPAILVPLAVYLTTAMSLPGLGWWAAALNVVPVQVTLFLGIAAWVDYLRRGTPLTLVATGLAVAAGMTFDVRAVLILPVLGFLALAYFTSGTLRQRIGQLVGRHRWGVLVLVALGAGYSAYYLVSVDQITERPAPGALRDIGSAMLGRALPTTALGGPWRWGSEDVPAVVSDPPVLGVAAAWLVLGWVVAYLALRRQRTLRAWLLLVGYAAMLAFLVASARSELGWTIGMDLRFLTETAALLTVCLGLALLELPGAAGSSLPRDPPLVVRLPRAVPAALLAVVVLGGTLSSVSYARLWHTANASDPFVHRLAADLDRLGAVDVADTPVPPDVMSPLLYPRNAARTLVGLLSPASALPRSTDDLLVVAGDGGLRRALIDPVLTSVPGPEPGCGWRVAATGAAVPLPAEAMDIGWWLRIGYLSNADSPVTITAGSTRVDTSVERGLGSLYVRVAGGRFDQIGLSGLDEAASVCVDTIEVGQVVPGGAP